MKLLKNKVFIISIISVLVIALLTGVLAMIGFSGPVKLVLGTLAKPFEYVGTWASNAVNGFVEVFSDYEELRAENEALKKELAEKEDESYNAQVLKEENEWLKGYLGFAAENYGFELTDASVIARESGNSASVITLNRGSVHGVKNEMPVITEDGVYGQVIEVGLDWCRVRSLVTPDSAVGAMVERSKSTGILEGDITSDGKYICTLTYLSGDADIKIGDRIYTSGGKGSSYPTGLYLGSVTELIPDEDTRTLTAKIETAVSFEGEKELSRFMIVTGYGKGSAK